MSSKILKNISVFLLSIICFSISCMFTLSVAVETYNASANIAEGKYYIKNKNTSLYIGSVNSNILQSSRNPTVDLQKWEVEYVSNGYYRIKNLHTGKYLTAPSTLTAGAIITEQVLSSTNNGQLWKFTDLESGQFATYKEYKISAKTHNGTNLALASDEYLGVEGCSVIQDNYVLDSMFDDEWVMIPIDYAYVIGINTSVSGHDHTSTLYGVRNNLLSHFYDVSLVTSPGLTSYTIKTYMEDSKIFIMRSDGGYDEIGTYIYSRSDKTTYFHAWDIYNYNGNNGIDLSECELAVFAGCYTANNIDQSLPDAAVRAGAKYAIGFVSAPPCSEISDWTELFIYEYNNGEDIEDAAFEAALESGSDDRIFDYWIFE